MIDNALSMGSDDNHLWGRLITLICCVVVISGIAYGTAAAQSGQYAGGDSSTTTASQNYSINISVTDSTGSTDTATIPITVPNASDSTNSSNSGSGLSAFDLDDSGQIERGEAVQVVIAYNTDGSVGGQSVDRGTAVQVVIAYNTDQSV